MITRPRSPRRPFPFPFLLAVGLLGCSGITGPDIGGPCRGRADTGGEICGQQFYYPTGIAIDPGDTSVLYVTNANADLRYASGSLVTVDTRMFECTLDYACKGARLFDAGCTPFSMANLDADCLPYAKTLADVKPVADPLHPANSSETTGKRGGCYEDLLDPSILVCDEELYLTGSVRVGNFAGSVRVQTDPPSAFNRRLWLPARGDPSITFVDVNATAPQPGGLGTVKLSCIDPNDHLPDVPDSCINQRVTVRDFHQPGAPGFACPNDQTACVSLPPEPFGIYLDQGCEDGTRTGGGPCPTVNNVQVAPYARLLVSHLQSGEITLIDARASDPRSTVDHKSAENVVLDVRGVGLPADSAGRRGAFSVVPREPGNPLGWWYVTSRISPILSTFRIASVSTVLGGPQFTIAGGTQFNVAGGPYSSGDDVREIVFDPCTPGNAGCRAFTVEGHPPSVFTLDTRLDNGAGVSPGTPRNQVVDIVEVCQGPSRLALRQTMQPGPEGMRQVNRLYVSCFASGQILVIDPDQATLVATILAGSGANEMAFNYGWDEVRGRELTLPSHGHRRMYVTDYLDNNVTVIDLDPGSPTENHVIGRIGTSDPPRVQQ